MLDIHILNLTYCCRKTREIFAVKNNGSGTCFKVNCLDNNTETDFTLKYIVIANIQFYF